MDASDLPAVERDFAFIVDAAITADQVVRAAKSVDRVLIERVDVFDVYEGKGVPEGKKSLAIAVRLQPKDHTLTDLRDRIDRRENRRRGRKIHRRRIADLRR